MNIQITGDELRKALKDIEEAEKHGFMFCEAVFNSTQRNEYWTVATYSDMWEKASLTDGSLDWGRGQDVSKRNYFKDGKLVPTKETKKMIDNYPASQAIEEGKIDGYKYWITDGGKYGGLNGYVAFPKKPVTENDYGGILTYVPVHGGITYAAQKKLGMIYGFDTAHSDSENYPHTDKEWIKKQCEKMIKGIKMAAKVEKKYLLAKTNKEKAKYADQVLNTDTEAENKYNFGIGINVLTGQL